jgi:multidrug efflux pump subunit AcrA (membrane-fusion protein)
MTRESTIGPTSHAMTTGEQFAAVSVADIDHELVDKTKKQIRQLVSESAELAKSKSTAEAFYEGFLNRTVSALASTGGAIWIENTETKSLEIAYHINVNQTCLASDTAAQIQHSLLIEKLKVDGQPVLIPPNSGSVSPTEPGNPTEFLLIIGPLKMDNVTIGLVEILQRPGAGATTQRGYLRFLAQMCEIASDFLKNHKIRNFNDQQLFWQQLEQFMRLIHLGLDVDQTIFAIANESRRIIDCDRVSVAMNLGRRCMVRAVSGLDSIERRADQVKTLNQLATSVLRTGQSLLYTGDDRDLPPQIELHLQDYLDKAHCKMLAIFPLRETISRSETNKTSNASRALPPTLGVLIVENLKERAVTPAMRRRIELIVDHSQAALTNAVQHNSLFLMPLWKSLGKVARPFRGSRLPKTVMAIIGVTAAIIFLCTFPYSFSLSASGQLTPESQHEIFALADGVLQEVYVDENGPMLVDAGQPLAKLTNNELMAELENLTGNINQTTEQINKLQRALGERLDTLDRIRLDGELNMALEARKSLQREREIAELKAQKLEIRSPIRGHVVNWKVRENLLRRPVSTGQNLMTIVDVDTSWELELELQENRVGHLTRQLRTSKEPVPVSFALVSHPGTIFEGQLVRVDKKMEVYSEGGNAARVKVQFDNSQIPPDLLRSGTRVRAKILCGTRSIGYVWFHELIETIQTAMRFWL